MLLVYKMRQSSSGRKKVKHMPIYRVDNWAGALNQYLKEQEEAPFAWGKNDCCLFAAGAIQAITGVDVAAGWRSAYKSSESALHLVSVRTEGSLRDLISTLAKKYGFPEINPKMAQRGDIIQFNSNIEGGVGLTLGVVVDHRLAIPAMDKIRAFPVDTIWDLPSTKAWKIG